MPARTAFPSANAKPGLDINIRISAAVPSQPAPVSARLRTVPAAAGGCDGVVMQSAKGMAASFLTEPFIVEPTVVYNVTYEVRTTGLVATTAYLTGGPHFRHISNKLRIH